MREPVWGRVRQRLGPQVAGRVGSEEGSDRLTDKPGMGFFRESSLKFLLFASSEHCNSGLASEKLLRKHRMSEPGKVKAAGDE